MPLVESSYPVGRSHPAGLVFARMGTMHASRREEHAYDVSSLYYRRG